MLILILVGLNVWLIAAVCLLRSLGSLVEDHARLGPLLACRLLDMEWLSIGLQGSILGWCLEV